MSQKTGTNFVKNKKKYFLIYPRPVRCQKENFFFIQIYFFIFKLIFKSLFMGRVIFEGFEELIDGSTFVATLIDSGKEGKVVG